MSIMDFFRGAQGDSATAAGDSVASQGSAPTGAPTSEGAGNPTVPQSGEGQNSGGEGTGEVSGLDAFKDIWDNNSDGNEGENSQDQDPTSFLNVDPRAIQEAVAKVDFSQVLDPETLGQISEGGEGAQQAFAKSMNSIAQHVFSQSMIANATLMKQALAKSTDSFDARAKETMRRSQIDQEISSSNPAFNHPSAKPLIESMQAQLAKKFPQASSKEIADKANQYFEQFANEIGAPKRREQESQRSKNEPDWEAFFADSQS